SPEPGTHRALYVTSSGGYMRRTYLTGSRLTGSACGLISIAVALAGIAAIPSIGAATVLPGGSSNADCISVLSVEGTAAPTNPSKLECMDGDPTCDQDGACNDSCQFIVEACQLQSGIGSCIPPAALKQPLRIHAKGVSIPPPASLSGAQCGLPT